MMKLTRTAYEIFVKAKVRLEPKQPCEPELRDAPRAMTGLFATLTNDQKARIKARAGAGKESFGDRSLPTGALKA